MKVWGIVNSLLRKRGSVREDPVGCFPMSSLAISSIALIIVESWVIRYRWTQNMVLSMRM